jgi:hypothetical protein
VATYDEWLDVFELAYHAPDRVSELECPSCGARALQLRYVISGSTGDRANPVFWRDGCLQGLFFCPGPVPAGCTSVRHDDADVPDFRIVPAAD